MIDRPKYVERLRAFQDHDLVKVVTGVRRSGKSTLLELMQADLVRQGVPRERILTFQMESMEFDGLTYRELYDAVTARAAGLAHPYLFFDELQEVSGWERAVNALRVDLDCDIYVTGSNAHLLSSELSTLISGRYVEVEMLPLTFAEYLAFRGYERDGDSPGLARAADGRVALVADLLADYRRYGGLPFLALSAPDQETHRDYMRTLHETVIARDILERARRRGERSLSSRDLLERICAFLADNVGNPCSVSGIAAAVRAGGLSAANDTVDAYVSALARAYLFYPCRRYDIRGKALLKTNGKHYVVDSGLRNYLSGYRDADRGRALENIVYLQLRHDGWDVSVGALRAGEVDFVARRGGETLYAQVTASMEDPATRDRELAPLRAVRDAWPKLVVVGAGDHPAEVDGIRIVGAADFLLGQAW